MTHYLLYIEGDELTSFNPFFNDFNTESIRTKDFFYSSSSKIINETIYDKFKEVLIDIIQDVQIKNVYKIKINSHFQPPKIFNYFLIHFTSELEFYNYINGGYYPKRQLEQILQEITLNLSKIPKIRQMSRYIVNTFISPKCKEKFKHEITKQTQSSKDQKKVDFYLSWEPYPFLLEFQHNFSCKLDDEITNIIKKYLKQDLAINHNKWDIHILNYSNQGIIIYPEEEADLHKIGNLLSDNLIQYIYGFYIRISDIMIDYQKKLMDLDLILPKLNYISFSNLNEDLKTFKHQSFGEFPWLFIQEIDRIIILEEKQDFYDPPFSSIFRNTLVGEGIIEKIRRAYDLLKNEINNVLSNLHLLISQKQNFIKSFSKSELMSRLENIKKEAEFQEMLVTILDDLGFNDIVINCGRRGHDEFGKDIVFSYRNKFNQIEWNAIVVKTGKIDQSIGRKINRKVEEIIDQGSEALEIPYKNEKGSNFKITRVFIATNEYITDKAKSTIIRDLGGHVFFIDKNILLNLI